MSSWNRWKYPILLTLLFAVFHSMSVLYEGPSPIVSLPADLRQLLEQRIILRGRFLPSLMKDRQTSKLRDGLFSSSAKSSQNISPEEMEELLEEYDDDDEENEEDDELDASNKTKLPSDTKRRSKKKKKGKQEQSASDKEESEMEKQSRQLMNELQKREIVGNERFLGGKYSMGIQRPEEFYERNRRDRHIVHSAVSKSPTNQSLQQPTSTRSTTTAKPAVSTAEPSNRKPTSVHAVERRSAPQGQNRTLNAGEGDVGREIRNTFAIKQSSKDLRGDGTSKNGALEIDSDVAEYREFLRRKYGQAHEIPSNSTSVGAVQPLPLDSASAVSKPPKIIDSVTSESSLNQPKLTKRKRKRKRKQKTTNGTTLETLMKLPYPPVVVKTEKLGFLDRVLAYNKAIADVRDKIFKVRGYRVWKDVVNASELTVIWGNEDDFLERLAEHPGVTTILLPWISHNNESTEYVSHGNSSGGGGDWSRWSSINDKSNLLVNEYYEWTATEQLCEWIRTPGFTKAHWDAVYNTICNEDPNRAIRPQSLEFMYLYGKPINRLHYWPNDGLSYPEYFYRRPPPYVFYVQLLEDSIVNAVGDVISGRLKLVPYTCSHDNLPTIPAEYPDRPVYRELFVITQFWGTSFFHKLIEVMPRIAPYIDFLRSNTGVQIHAPEDRSQVSEMLRILGINPERIVTGIARAKLVYLPQGTPCGFPDAREIQLLSHRFRNYIRSSLLSADELRHRLLLMVRRSGMRRFVHQTPIEYALQKLAERYGLNFTVFPDNPTPPMPVAMRLFNAAAVVVGPHGAGLSNVIFSEPGTVVVEGVCNEPHVNMCYQFTAHSLGLRYHALPSQRGCESIIDVLPETIEETVEFYLKMIASSGDEANKNIS